MQITKKLHGMTCCYGWLRHCDRQFSEQALAEHVQKTCTLIHRVFALWSISKAEDFQLAIPAFSLLAGDDGNHIAYYTEQIQ